MPSASNNNNNYKLEKQASFSSTHTGGGSGGSGSQLISSSATSSSGQSVSATSSNIAPPVSNATDFVSTAAIAANNNNNESNISNNTKEKTSSSSATSATGTGGSSAGGGVANATDHAHNPMKQALVTIDHKIRNLEKRKTKLESYRSIQATGKELSADQKAAVAKYDAVMATLEFARDLSKQMVQFSKDAEKEQKKIARKELVVRAHAETAKIREVLIMQNIMTCFSDETVRSDFLNGENGAIKLDLAEVEALRRFCIDIQTRRPETVDDLPFTATAQKAAEFFSMTIDGRPKQHGDTTFENLRKIFNQVQECGYLDKIYMVVPDAEVMSEEGQPLDASKTSEGDDAMVNVDMQNLSVSESSIESAVSQQQLNILPGILTDEKSLVAELPVELPAQPQRTDSVQQQQQQQAQQQQQQQSQHQQVNLPLAPQPQTIVGLAGTFSAAPQPPAPQSGATTPVQLQALFPVAPQPQQQQQQQLTQVAPQLQPVGAPGLIGVQPIAAPPGHVVGGPAPTQQQQPTSQPRQLMTSSPVGAQLPLPGGPPMALHVAPPPAHFSATTVRAVEHGLLRQHQQYMQQMRPLAEVIGGGSFYFLQDSELDSPDLAPGPVAAPNPVGSLIFEQTTATQPQQPQAQQQPAPPQQQSSLMHHSGDLAKASELSKAAAEQQQLLVNSLQQQQQQQQPNQTPQQQQQQQQIPTQTFTNQSFPNLAPMQAPPGGPAVVTTVVSASASNRNNTTATASPMFPQKQPQQQQLFSPVSSFQQPQFLHQPPNDLSGNSGGTATQNLLNEHQPQNQPQLMIMGRRLPGVPGVGEPGGVATGGFTFENPVVNALSYEQQMQQQLAAAVGLNPPATEDKKLLVDDGHSHKFANDAVSEWEVSLKNATRVTGSAGGGGVVSSNAATSLSNILKNASVIESNKWSSEMSATGPPNTPASTSVAAARKNEWTTSASSSSSYNDVGAAQAVESNHWNAAAASQQQEVSVGGYGRGGNGNSRGPNSYQRRGGDDRRGGDRGADERGPRGGPVGSGGPNASSNYRGGRTGNYGGNSAAQPQNGQRTNNSGIFFRNNESAGSSPYYQNGGGVYNSAGKEPGARFDTSSYRGPRGNGGNGGGGGGSGGNATRGGNPPPQRSIGGRNNGGNGGGVGGTANAASSYMGPRQTGNRMPMGLENKN